MSVAGHRRHVILVGLPGSGKTTIGRLLADLLDAPFHDVDPLIEAHLGISVPRIFAELGEPAFRAVESRLVGHLLEGPPAILASGGGWAAQPGNLQSAKSRAAVLIYLATSPESAALRTAGDQTRPLLPDRDRQARLRELLAAREPYYSQSDVTVQTDGRTPAAVAEEVTQLARRRAGWGEG